MALYLPHPVDYASIPLDSPMTSLKYIGPYLAERFRTESIWPLGSRQQHPIHTVRDLCDFFRTRRVVQGARRRLTAWLERITTNGRPRQCVEPGKFVVPGGDYHRYHVRDVNECGFNVIVGFLRYHFPAAPHDQKIPHPKRGRQAHVKYPALCRVQG
jgi:hypothetical protein